MADLSFWSCWTDIPPGFEREGIESAPVSAKMLVHCMSCTAGLSHYVRAAAVADDLGAVIIFNDTKVRKERKIDIHLFTPVRQKE